jgi:glycosyltransferase involved in cell wall biosynthesis
MMKVLMLLKTTGLEYDDRIRKECKSLLGMGVQPVVGVLEDSNRAHAGRTADGVGFRAVSLWSRSLLPSAKGLGVKTAELYVRFAAMVLQEKPEVLWIHDLSMSGFVPLGCLLKSAGRMRKLVWDQHELPSDRTLASGWKMRALKWLMSLCDAIVVANHERCVLLVERYGKGGGPPFRVIENFPDATFSALPKGELPVKIQSWLQGMPYLLTQGGGEPGRMLEESVEAVMRLQSVKLVVVGRFPESARRHLRVQWGEALDQFVLFTGMVAQMEMNRYIDRALASIVFYKQTGMNEWLCAPNRLYQAVCRGVPVLVGWNPPLRDFVEKTGAGIALETDGTDVDAILRGIQCLVEGREPFAQKAEQAKASFLWNTQDPILKFLVEPGGFELGDPRTAQVQGGAGREEGVGARGGACARAGPS